MKKHGEKDLPEETQIIIYIRIVFFDVEPCNPVHINRRFRGDSAYDGGSKDL